jgi:hypothetical protein
MEAQKVKERGIKWRKIEDEEWKRERKVRRGDGREKVGGRRNRREKENRRGKEGRKVRR